MAGNPEEAKHLSWLAHLDITDTKGIMQTWIDSYASKGTYHWGVVCKDNGNQVIGSIGAVQ
ncbi:MULTISPECIES: hypothetical protein [Clostridium]|uniref:Acetyltransferase (GNAT) domain-containing protein n=1 Tax=Clostridium frigoriphilum TaxID=443253 RepID=A0ABU7USZ1_9CLOT|nr:hypothetical protein [Clostridium sp. DSM 17811]